MIMSIEKDYSEFILDLLILLKVSCHASCSFFEE